MSLSDRATGDPSMDPLPLRRSTRRRKPPPACGKQGLAFKYYSVALSIDENEGEKSCCGPASCTVNNSQYPTNIIGFTICAVLTFPLIAGTVSGWGRLWCSYSMASGAIRGDLHELGTIPARHPTTGYHATLRSRERGLELINHQRRVVNMSLSDRVMGDPPMGPGVVERSNAQEKAPASTGQRGYKCAP